MKANRYDNYTPEISENVMITDDPLVYSEPTGYGAAEPAAPIPGDITEEPKPRKRGAKGAKKQAKTASEKRTAKPRKATQEIPWTERIKALYENGSLRYMLGIFLCCFGTYLAVAFFSYLKNCIADQSEIHNAAMGMAQVNNLAGEGGARLADIFIDSSFGLASVVIIFWVFAMACKQFGIGMRFKAVNFTIKCFVALIALSLIIGLCTIGLESPVNWGGIHGRYVNEFVIHFLGWIGALILSIFVLSLFVMICLRDVIKWIIKVKHKRDEARAKRKAEKEEREAREAELRELEAREIAEARQAAGLDVEETATTEPTLTVEFQGSSADGTDNASYEIRDIDDEDPVTELSLKGKKSDNEPADEPSNESANGPQEAEKQEDDTEAQPSNENPEEEADNTGNAPMVVNVNQIEEVKEKRPESSNANANELCAHYKFPPYDLLREGVTKVSLDESEQLENEERIRNTLADFGITITSIEATIGPTVTLYEIVPDTGIKISKIASLADDIALRLAARGVRIIPQVPGKGTVGIEVPNKDPQTVSMRTILQSRKFRESNFKLPLALGSTISNEVFVADLAKMPHLLVAGATGQGKSVGLNAIIASLLYSKKPSELKFVMVDPKMVEFSIYSKIEKHYLAKLPDESEPIIVNMEKVVPTLSALCVEMDQRYQLLRMAHTRNIEEYNAKINAHQLNYDDGHRFLPYIVLVVDEFADLIMTSGKEVETPIARLAQKARAVGMHVIIATQRPSTNVITGIIKGNFPARIAFRVSSGVDSKTILDHTGAQTLIGKGDMLVSINSETTRVQCAFIDTPECESLCEYIERQPYNAGAYILPEPVLTGDNDSAPSGRIAGPSAGDRDPLYNEIARKIAMSDSVSTSYLQRTYGLGFARAGRIMDQMEAAGIVGPSHNGKPRKVLVDSAGIENILND